jgi:hypothetical protein
MKLFLSLLLIAVSGFAAASKDVHRTVPLAADGRLTIDTYKGSIRVSTWDRAEVDIAVRIEEDSSWIPQPVDAADVRIDAGAREVRLESHYDVPRFFSFTGSQPFFHYTIRMPRTANLRIKDYKSETEVEDLAADLDMETYKGSVQVRGLAGALRLSTYKGDVRADFAEFNTRSTVETYKGRIDLGVPQQAGFELQAELERKAELHSDFTQFVRTSSRRDRSKTIRGPVNGGGPLLRLESYKGSFRLRQR